MKTFRYKSATFEVVQGNIVEQEVDVIVNAANSSLLGGGGVDGAIHRAGGPAILEECKKIRAAQGGCPTGEAVITTAGDLKATHVVHTVGPVWRGGNDGEMVLLERAYRNSIELAAKNGATSIAFPSISTGAYRFPLDRASYVAVRTAILFLDEGGAMDTIRFVLFGERDFELFSQVFDEVTLTMTGS
ncbi:MAG: O-acetyl-ADP-ribose deacetylase [Myxococcota bacterium]|nr:O-acetyl-ADP-ribose deacetylase [Myxococcota bacterium]